MFMVLNRQGAKNAKRCEPPRRQGAKKFFCYEVGSAQLVRIRIELPVGLLLFQGFLGALAPWRFKMISWRSWRLGGSTRFPGVLAV
jgi:hypothetical protein